jgi:hypothetical protein
MPDPAPCVMNDMTSLQMKSFPSRRGEDLKKVWCLTGRYVWIIRARRRYNVAQMKMGETTIKEDDVA